MSKILSCPFPTTLSPLAANGFRLSINKIPEFSFFCQTVHLPKLALPPVTMTNPMVSVHLPGTELEYENLVVEFLVDADMGNYLSIHNWLVGLGFPEDYQQYTDFVDGAILPTKTELTKNYSGGTLEVMNQMGGTAKTIQFVDLHPVSLESITFTTKATDVMYIGGRVEFSYTLYKFI